MNEKTLKRGYYFPEKLLDEWERFHFPSKDFSPSAAAAFLLYMSLGDNPDIRERSRKLAFSDNPRRAAKDLKQALIKALLGAEVVKVLQGLTPEEFSEVLANASKYKLSQKK